MSNDMGNGRVTMAILGERLDNTIERVKKVGECQDVMDAKLNQVLLEIARLNALRQDIEDLKKRSDRWDTATGAFTLLLTTIAAWLGINR